MSIFLYDGASGGRGDRELAQGPELRGSNTHLVSRGASWEVDSCGQDQCRFGWEKAAAGVEARAVGHYERVTISIMGRLKGERESSNAAQLTEKDRQFHSSAASRLGARSCGDEEHPAAGVDAKVGGAANEGAIGPDELAINDRPGRGYRADVGLDRQRRRIHAGARRHLLAPAEELPIDDAELDGLGTLCWVVDAGVPDEPAADLPAGLGAWDIGWADSDDKGAGRWDYRPDWDGPRCRGRRHLRRTRATRRGGSRASAAGGRTILGASWKASRYCEVLSAGGSDNSAAVTRP